jgi:hypothetical protein
MNRNEYEYHIGLDLGQKQDFTAIAVVERAEVATAEIDRVTYERIRETHFGLRYLERVKLGTSYPAIVERVRQVVEGRLATERCTLVVDATGVGAPVMDMLRGARLGCAIVPVVITGGDRATQSGGIWRVPKRDLVMGLQVMFEERELQISEKLADAATLVTELMSMRVKISPAGHDSYGAASGAREGPHDDLVLAVALAVWRAKGWERRSMFGTQSLGMVY